MNLDNIINILFKHMELNNLVDDLDVDNIINQFPESIYSLYFSLCFLVNNCMA